jgi:hypothetical protein
MAERVGFEPTQPRMGGWPPGSNRALFQAQSPLHGGSGGSRTHTGRVLSPLPLPIGLRSRWCRRWDSNPATSRLSTWCLCQLGLRRRGAPPRIRTGNLSLLRRAPLPSWARGAIERTWRRVEGSNPQRSLVAPVFGTGCRPLQRHPPECKKPPRLITEGAFSRGCCLLFELHVNPPGDRQRKVT